MDISDDVIYLCYLNLIMTMFRLTAQDIKYGDKDLSKQAKRFLSSRWFVQICECTNLDPIQTKYIILHNTRISGRRAIE